MGEPGGRELAIWGTEKGDEEETQRENGCVSRREGKKQRWCQRRWLIAPLLMCIFYRRVNKPWLIASVLETETRAAERAEHPHGFGVLLKTCPLFYQWLTDLAVLVYRRRKRYWDISMNDVSANPPAPPVILLVEKDNNIMFFTHHAKLAALLRVINIPLGV